jgi:hypothetical protein
MRAMEKLAMSQAGIASFWLIPTKSKRNINRGTPIKLESCIPI